MTQNLQLEAPTLRIPKSALSFLNTELKPCILVLVYKGPRYIGSVIVGRTKEDNIIEDLPLNRDGNISLRFIEASEFKPWEATECAYCGVAKYIGYFCYAPNGFAFFTCLNCALNS